MTSPDPIQQKLRLLKKQWNKDVSAFIDDLIHYKKLTNGQPNKFYKERSSIKDPIPADPATIIGSLASDFQELSQRGNSIIAAQAEYSRTRRKKQPKPAPGTPVTNVIAPVSVPQTPPANDLSKQLSAFEHKYGYGLVAEGSNPITRFFTKLFNPTIGFGSAAELRRARIAMLNACADTYRNLGKFQVQVVKSSPASITESHKKLQEAWNHWTLVSRAYAIYKNSKSVGAADKGGSIEHEVSQQDLKEEKALENLDKSVQDFAEHVKNPVVAPPEDAMDQVSEETPPSTGSDLSPLFKLEKTKNMVSDYRRYQEQLPPNSGAGGYLYELDAAVDKFIATRGKHISPEFDQFYEKSIRYLNEEYGTNAASFKDIVSQLRAKVKQQMKPVPVAPVLPPVVPVDTEKTSLGQMEKVSQDFLKKWVGKTMHQLSLFDKTSTHRLSCYRMAAELRKEINQIMDLLEKGLDEDKLDPVIKQANSKIISLRGMMRSLHLSAGKAVA